MGDPRLVAAIDSPDWEDWVDYPACPRCGTPDQDFHEQITVPRPCYHDGDTFTLRCGDCRIDFKVTASVEYSYSTEMIPNAGG